MQSGSFTNGGVVMRRIMLAAALVLAAAPLAAQGSDPDMKVSGAGALPAGWVARLDRSTASMDNVKFVTMGPGYHATLGPAGIFYNPKDQASGSFTARATFTQTKAPTHPEAYGIFVGGQNLTQPNQSYVYFIVRGDGKYMVKHRAGSEVHTIVDWTDSPAVVKQDAEGKATNTVAIRSTKDSITYWVNDTRVYGQDRAHAGMTATDGQVGLRVNHNLDVHISNFSVTPGVGSAPAKSAKVTKDAKP